MPDNLAFEDDDRRDFRQDDLMVCCPCPLLAACYADSQLDLAWQWGESPSYEASLTCWRKHVRIGLETGAILFWKLQLQHHSPERTT